MSDLTQKIQTLLSQPTLAEFATVTRDGKPWVRYVMAAMDESMTIRFATFIGARKVAQIENNPEVHLTAGVGDPSKDTNYIQVQGTATLVTDEAERHAFWVPILKGVFSGPDDPNYGVIIIKSYRIEYCSAGTLKPEVWEAE